MLVGTVISAKVSFSQKGLSWLLHLEQSLPTLYVSLSLESMAPTS